MTIFQCDVCGQHFGESGKPDELFEHFGLTGKHIAMAAHEMFAYRKH